jgi:hypothetical protein
VRSVTSGAVASTLGETMAGLLRAGDIPRLGGGEGELILCMFYRIMRWRYSFAGKAHRIELEWSPPSPIQPQSNRIRFGYDQAGSHPPKNLRVFLSLCVGGLAFFIDICVGDVKLRRGWVICLEPRLCRETGEMVRRGRMEKARFAKGVRSRDGKRRCAWANALGFRTGCMRRSDRACWDL